MKSTEEDVNALFLNKIDPAFHFTQLLDYLPEVYYFAKDIQGRFVDANLAQLHVLGLSRIEELLGRTDFDFFSSAVATRYQEEDNRIMTTGRPMVNQAQIVPEKGEVRWFITTKVPLYDGEKNPIGVAGVMRDYYKTSTMLQQHDEMKGVVQHILENLSKKLYVDELAALAGLSERQFERKFKQLFMLSPQQFILKVRLEAACQALSTTTTSVAQIALQHGFFDQSYFTRQFTRNIGVTPKKYRKQHG